jgi:hypothetical protein
VAKLFEKWTGLLAKILTITLLRREVAKLSDKWSVLLAKLLTFYPPFSGEKWPSYMTSGVGY